MENYSTTSVAALAARAVTHVPAGVKQQGIAMTNAAFAVSGAFRVTDDVVPGHRAWSPPA